jgi:hypothetical protein
MTGWAKSAWPTPPFPPHSPMRTHFSCRHVGPTRQPLVPCLRSMTGGPPSSALSLLPVFVVHAALPLAPWNSEFVAGGLGPTPQGYKNVSQAPQTETKRERNEKQARTTPRIGAGKENPIPSPWTFLSIGIEASLAIHGLPLDARTGIRTITGPTCWPEPNQSLVRLHGAPQNHQAAMADLDATLSLGTPC